MRFTLRVHLYARNPGGCYFGNDLGRYGGVKLILPAGPLLRVGEPKTYMEVEGHQILDFRFNTLQVRSIFHEGFCEDLARQNIQLSSGVVTYGLRTITYGVRVVTCGVRVVTCGVRVVTVGVRVVTYGVRVVTYGVRVVV